MSKYTQEQFDQLPDFVKDNLEKVGDHYTDKGLIKVKATADKLNSDLEAERRERQSTNERLSKLEQEQSEKIEAARAEALEQARTKGDVDAIEKRYKEQMEDLEKRTAEKVRNETIAEFQLERDKDSAKNTAESIATKLAVDEDASEPLFELIKNRVTFEKGSKIFLASDGSATTMTEQEFMTEVKKDPRYKYLLKADTPTKGSGFSKSNQANEGSAQNRGSNFVNTQKSKLERTKRIQERMDARN